jgi:type I restriction enzyme S subunit
MYLLKEQHQAIISDAVTKGLDPNVPLKPSGIEWLGDVPKHWGIERGRFLFRKLDIPPEPEDGVVTAFRDGQVTLRENRRTDGFTLAVLEVGYQRVREGDLVIHGMDAFAGAIGVSESTGKCTPEYAVLTPIRQGINSRYFAMVLRLMAQRNFVFVICPSVRERAPRFRFEAFKDVQLPVPSLEEQERIVRYIDTLGKESNALAVQAELAIDLLQERRTALISAAVTGQRDVRSFNGNHA